MNKRFLSVSKVINKGTGDSVKLNSNDKQVYNYIFNVSEGASVCVGIPLISYDLGISEGTVLNCVKTLILTGLLERERTKVRGRWGATYYKCVDTPAVQFIDLNNNDITDKVLV